jgi:formylglycine-generating enzyme required for sulfatase activity
MTKSLLGLVGLGLFCLSLAGQTKVNPKDEQLYVWIAPGTFTMGCSATDHNCAPDESPAHSAEITRDFWMGQTPVTVAAWEHYRTVAGKPALPAADEFGRKLNEAAGDDNQPVVSETWEEARGYCTWAGMRLPTEAEWEYAARAGTTGASYAWLDQIAWYADNSGKKPVDGAELYRSDSPKYQKRLFNNGNGPRAVKQKTPNAWGLYDILGNVWQWTADYYASDYYAASAPQNPTGPREGMQRVLRGGAWNSVQGNVRVSYRLTNPPGDRVNAFGFRCVGDLP